MHTIVYLIFFLFFWVPPWVQRRRALSLLSLISIHPYHLCVSIVLVRTGASLTTTSDTAFRVLLVIFELMPWYSAYTCTSVVFFFGYNTIDTAKLLIALLLPFGNQISIHVLLSKKVIVEFSRNELFLVVHAVDISAYLMI